jgi:hypothetical protein
MQAGTQHYSIVAAAHFCMYGLCVNHVYDNVHNGGHYQTRFYPGDGHQQKQMRQKVRWQWLT